jgi:hypothetical protein
MPVAPKINPSFHLGLPQQGHAVGSHAMQKLKLSRPVVKFSMAVLLVCGLWMISVCAQSVKWVGRTDLEMHFLVTDAATGQPIPNAVVQIRAEAGGFCDDQENRRFTITADGNGHAKHVCTNCMCFGSRSCFENTFAVHLPWWWVNAKAIGYSDSEPEYINVPENSQRVERGKPFPSIAIPIRLVKSMAEPRST